MNYRKEYTKSELLESTVLPSPFEQFAIWFAEHLASKPVEPDAVILATATPDGMPSARTVLVREHGPAGFVFFTNYESQKGRELIANPRAELLFYWPDPERQVRVSGRVEKLERAKSEEYFKGRPRGSQIGALASTQSQVVNGREELQKRFSEFEVKLHGKEIGCPANWGGFRVIPARFEFWQGRENRMHDRIQYLAQGQNWGISRLAP